MIRYGPLGFEIEDDGRPKRCPSTILPPSSLSSSSSSPPLEGAALVYQKAWPGIAHDNPLPIQNYLDPYYSVLHKKVLFFYPFSFLFCFILLLLSLLMIK